VSLSPAGGSLRPLSPMSSSAVGGSFLVECDVGEHGSVDDVGEPSLQGADGFFSGRASFGAPLEEGGRSGV
jgi:hypothetical protein